MTTVDLAPIVRTLEVRRSAADAFTIFTQEITSWWPLATHTLAKDVKGEKTVRVTVEPKVGGRVYETLNTGEERHWGDVLAFDPGRRFAYTFRMGRPPERGSEVEVRFDPLGPDSCRVTLSHAHWDRMDPDVEKERRSITGGWDAVFMKGFAGYVGAA
jgi:hypothetical protein